MSIRTISRAGGVIGYQAVAGAGRQGATEHFAVAKYGPADALRRAEVREAELRSAQPKATRPAMLGNRGGIVKDLTQRTNPRTSPAEHYLSR